MAIPYLGGRGGSFLEDVHIYLFGQHRLSGLWPFQRSVVKTALSKSIDPLPRERVEDETCAAFG